MSDVIVGARCRFALDGKVMAYASNVSGGHAIEWTPLDVLGMLKKAEFVATGYTANLTATLFRLINKSVRSLGVMPSYQDILTSGSLTAVIEDIISGKVVSKGLGIRISEERFDLNARSPVTTNLTFVIEQLLDEKDTAA